MKRYPRGSRPGERTNRTGKPVRNTILLALSDTEFASIRPELEFLELPGHRRLYEPHRDIEFVYFPNRGLISLVIAMQDSKTVEVGLVGNEGVAGVACVFGLTRSPVSEVVQVAGNGFRLSARVLRQSLPSSPQLKELLGRYSMALGMQSSQTAACNRLHDIEQRLARWLLMAQDRVHANRIAITHDFLATMLGTDRPTVSTTAAKLQRKQVIRYTRGATTIIDREKLEKIACECYRVIQQFSGEEHLE